MEGTKAKKIPRKTTKKNRRVVSQKQLLAEHLHYVVAHVSQPNLKARAHKHTADAS